MQHTEWFQDITYDGLALSVMFDPWPCEIMAKSTGDNWTDSFQPHIKSLIFTAAVQAAKAERADAAYDLAVARAEAMRDDAELEAA
jgi:hypothetical protein